MFVRAKELLDGRLTRQMKVGCRPTSAARAAVRPTVVLWLGHSRPLKTRYKALRANLAQSQGDASGLGWEAQSFS